MDTTHTRFRRRGSSPASLLPFTPLLAVAIVVYVSVASPAPHDDLDRYRTGNLDQTVAADVASPGREAPSVAVDDQVVIEAITLASGTCQIRWQTHADADVGQATYEGLGGCSADVARAVLLATGNLER